jgi:shikimate kinase
MGAGKTSVGRTLARHLGWGFDDLDDRIETRAKRSIAEIFRDLGEAGFRRLENAALRELLGELSAGPRVVALGGGAYAQPQNATLLESTRVPVVFWMAR